MNRVRGHEVLHLVACCIVGIVLPNGCSDTTHWYPEGDAEIVEYHREGDAFGTIVLATYKISNSGSSVIFVTTLNVKIVTDSRTYYVTIVDATRVLPEGHIFGTFELPCDAVVVETADVYVESVFFE